MTVAAVEGPHNVNDHNSDSGEEILVHDRREPWRRRAPTRSYRGGDHFVVLGPEHAAVIANSGFSRADAQAYLYEHARVAVARIGAEEARGSQRLGRLRRASSRAGAAASRSRAPPRRSASSWPAVRANTRRGFRPSDRPTARPAESRRSRPRSRRRFRRARRLRSLRVARAPDGERRRGRDRLGSGPAGLHRGALRGARQPRAARHRRAYARRPLAGDDRGRELSRATATACSGPQLIMDLRDQAERFGARYAGGTVTRIEVAREARR